MGKLARVLCVFVAVAMGMVAVAPAPVDALQADTTPPEIRIVSPVDGWVYDGTGRGLEPVFEATDDIEVVRVTYTIRNTESGDYYHPVFPIDRYSGRWKAERRVLGATREGATNQFHALRVGGNIQTLGHTEVSATAFDAAGNRSTAVVLVSTAKETVRPIITILDPTPAVGEVTPAGTVQIAFRVTDDSPAPIPWVNLRVNIPGIANFITLEPGADGIYRFTAEVPSGRHAVIIRARDVWGNGAIDELVEILAVTGGADTTAPEVEARASFRPTGDVRLRASVSDDGGLARVFGFIQNVDTGQYLTSGNNGEFVDGFQRFRLSGQTPGPFEFSRRRTLAPGNYKFGVVAVDLLGNTAKSTTSVTVPG